MQGPRDRINWNDWNMLQAIVASLRSPDPNTQVGAYICTQDNRPISMGYNGLTKGLSPLDINWARTGKEEDTKYPYVVHAEKNAILNATKPLNGTCLYVTLFPCNACAQDIIQSGITDIFYLEDKYPNIWQTTTSRYMLRHADVNIRQYSWQDQKMIKTQLSYLSSLIT